MDAIERCEEICDTAEEPNRDSSIEKIEMEECSINMDSETNSQDLEEMSVEDLLTDGDDSSFQSFVIVLKNPPPSLCECPPPVCSMLTEQLVVFTILSTLCICLFLIYWFVED